MAELFDPPDQQITLPGGDLLYLSRPDWGVPTATLLAALIHDTPWRQDSVTIFGHTHAQPRLHHWVGDPECTYRYSGLTLDPAPWTPLLSRLRDRVAVVGHSSFNSVLLNYYRTGADAMGLHADDEPELGRRPVIASLSLGAERTFVLRHRHDRTIPPFRLPLADGSLLLMRGDTQANWKHEIPRTRRAIGPRVNLTFRQIVQADGRAL